MKQKVMVALIAVGTLLLLSGSDKGAAAVGLALLIVGVAGVRND